MSREIIENVFSKDQAELIWSANVPIVYPATLQGFSVGSVLPAVFYMFRRGFRRGRGRFHETFTPADTPARPTIYMVAAKLSQDTAAFAGFDSDITKDILGDLLLCDALENKNHAEGHHVEVQRAYPVHYFASWLDLPYWVANLRLVPELLVALLADQDQGPVVQPSAEGEFCIARNPHRNIFFRIFGHGVRFGPNPADLAGDSFDETQQLSVEELLMVRLGLACGQAPEKTKLIMRASAEIPNLRPLSARATEIFRNDLSTFLRAYGPVIPRRAITPMLECVIGLGLWHTFLASLAAILEWNRTGKIPSTADQRPPAVFVDASAGTDPDLRLRSEQSIEDMLRMVDEATVVLACVRVLDAIVRYDRELKAFRPAGPNTVQWLELLGDVRFGRHRRAELILTSLHEKAVLLAEQLAQQQLYPEAVDILKSGLSSTDPARAIAEAVCIMMGNHLLRDHYLKFLDSAGMVSEPHGLLRKRKVSRRMPDGQRRGTEARSVTLSNTLLETLVHRYLAGRDRPLAFAEFLNLLRDNYGLFVHEAPPGTEIPKHELLRNRMILERRLRDLGLLTSVSDAESMKHLNARYQHENAFCH